MHLQACDIWCVQKLQLKVQICSDKCESKVREEIKKVEGVSNVSAVQGEKKVVVVVSSGDSNYKHDQILRKAKKIDKKAMFVEVDGKEREFKGK